MAGSSASDTEVQLSRHESAVSAAYNAAAVVSRQASAMNSMAWFEFELLTPESALMGSLWPTVWALWTQTTPFLFAQPHTGKVLST